MLCLNLIFKLYYKVVQINSKRKACENMIKLENCVLLR